MENYSNFESKQDSQLVTMLKLHNIPFEAWGTGDAKTLTHLETEFFSGESIFSTDEKGELVRHIAILYVDVFYTDPTTNKQYKLSEDKQVFKDGRIRRRTSLPGSVAEKLHPKEQADQSSVNRALAEELGITSELNAEKVSENITLGDSRSFPGLNTEAKNYHYRVSIPTEDFRPEGYIEHQDDKDTHFVWHEIQRA